MYKMRKNILIFGHNYATQFVDIFNQYACLFDRQKYHVTIAYLTGKPDEDIRARTLADEVLFLEAPKSSLRGLKIGQIKQLFKLCHERNFEIVVCHRYKPTYIMLWVAQMIKIPALIFVMHELNTMASINRRLLIAALYRKNMIFAGVSNAVRDDIRKHIWRVPQENVVTLYNVIDVPLTEPQLLSREAARKALQLDPTEFVFGHVARLVPNKDQQSLLRAFAAAKKKGAEAKLIIIGNGFLEGELKQLVGILGLKQDVIFTGYLSAGFSYMRAFDCFVLSSTQEAFGRVLLEAMIAHCPIIATRTNGIPEVVGRAGTLVTPRATDELAAAMLRMYQLSTEDRQRIADNAYLHMQENFSLPIFERTFWQLPLIENLQPKTT